MEMSKTSKKQNSGFRGKNLKGQSGKKKFSNYRRRRITPNSPGPANRAGPSRYTFYSILNTSFTMDQGNAAASIARGFLALCFKLDASEIKSRCFDEWARTGEKIVVLKGYDHKHLKYLRDEVRYSAIESDTLHKKWDKGQAILVLTVFGQEEELEDTFHGLSLLR